MLSIKSRAGGAGRGRASRGFVGSAVAVLVAATLTVSGCSAPVAPAAGGPVPTLAALNGDLSAHDPGLVVGGSAGNTDNASADWFVFSTGDQAVGDGNIQIRRSVDGVTWKPVGTVWKTKPAWLEAAVPGVTNLWAPELHFHDGTWYLYYAASTFGSNTSLIALATNTTLDPTAAGYEWVDRGTVIASQKSDDFNAIDPAIVDASDASGADGTAGPVMAFGSFWSGIREVKLQWPSGLRADDAVPLALADRQTPPNAIEGATIVPHDGSYFLIVSRDSCCRGVASTYNMAVGRSDSAAGPFVDRQGTPMLQNGGTPLLATDGTRIGPGGESYSAGYLAYHFYNGALGGATQLAITPLDWDADGWPVIRE